MSDLQKYIKKRKARDPEFAKGFDTGYEQFKIGFNQLRIFFAGSIFPLLRDPLDGLSQIFTFR